MAMKFDIKKQMLAIGLLSIAPILVVSLSVYGVDPLFTRALSYLGCFCYSIFLLVAIVKRKSNNVILLTCIAYFIVMLSVGSTSWPLRVFFHYYQEDFEIVLSKYDDGTLKQESISIGLFEVLRIEKSGPSYILWIDDSKDGGVAFIKGNDPNYFASIWSKEKLSLEWQYIVFD